MRQRRKDDPGGGAVGNGDDGHVRHSYGTDGGDGGVVGGRVGCASEAEVDAETGALLPVGAAEGLPVIGEEDENDGHWQITKADQIS